MTKQRDTSIDLARAFCIFFMVVGHCYSASANASHFVRWFYSFHMPFFFIISGFLMHVGDMQKKKKFEWNAFLSYTLKKVKTLLVPYYISSLFMQLVICAMQIIGGSFTLKESILNPVIYILEFIYNAQWFLPAMFFSTCVFYFIRYCKNYIGILLCVMLGIIGTIVSTDKILIRDILRVCVGISFMGIGYYFYGYLESFKRRSILLLFSIVCIHFVFSMMTRLHHWLL